MEWSDLWDYTVELLENIKPISQIYISLINMVIPDGNPNNAIDINTVSGIRTYEVIQLLSIYSNDIKDYLEGLISRVETGLSNDTATIERILELNGVVNSIAGYEVLDINDQEERYERYKKQTEKEILVDI